MMISWDLVVLELEFVYFSVIKKLVSCKKYNIITMCLKTKSIIIIIIID